MRSFPWPRVAVCALIVLGFASCGPQRGQFAPACPIPDVVKPLDELTRYRSGSRDVRDLIIHARIVNVIGKCEAGDNPGIVVATAQAVIDMNRGPAFQGQAYDLPVFVAVTDQDAVRDKILLALRVEFSGNLDTARALTQPIRMEIPVSPTKSAAAYGIIAGFQ